MIRAGEQRPRPIVMTALATAAGMIPLALGWGAGSQMLQPLAVAVIGGILASMVLSLVITPAVHYYLADRTPQLFRTHCFVVVYLALPAVPLPRFGPGRYP
jgi:multidrug efflux pump subunit AcrB